ncbi:hypothetical protein Gotur_035574, partial [Gossypium turneri]
YGLIVFPKVLGHIEVAVVDFFEKLRKGINPIPTILAETFLSLNACRKKGEGRFIGCAQLLSVWIFSHFCKVERTPFHMFSKTFAPLEARIEKDWPRDVTEQYWCENQDWVPLIGLWGGVGYAPLMVQRQFASRQFVPVTDGLAQSEFAFTGEGYMKKVRDTANSWRKIYLLELALYANTITKSKEGGGKSCTYYDRVEEKNIEFETVSVKLMTSQSEHQELRGKIRDLENALQAHQHIWMI